MNQETENKLVNEWNRLRVRRATLEIEYARLCHRIRAEFPPGANGDAAASEFVRVKCGDGRHAAESICAIAAAWEAVGQSPDAWESIGGADSAFVLRELPVRQIASVVSDALQEVAEQDKPVGPHLVRRIAEENGWLAKPRPSSAGALAQLAAYVAALHEKHELPNPPAAIAKILRGAAPRKRA